MREIGKYLAGRLYFLRPGFARPKREGQASM
jgi:hypothetical protein